MANLSDKFDLFHDRIALSACTQTALGITRDAIRERIRRYFRDTLKVRPPQFQSQGAYVTDVTVNPIEGKHHIEDGVYLQHLDKLDFSNWPVPATVHQWLVNATEGHHMEISADTSTCVRVRNAGQDCVDLACYADLNGQTMLALRGTANWSVSNPLAMTEWFKSYVNLHGEQLRRVVRYLKAWADFQSKGRGKLPNGAILDILAVYNFHSDKRDDLALARTLDAISNYVRAIVYVLNPVDITEQLAARWTETQKTCFQEAIQAAALAANAAIIIDDEHKASRLWRKQFGDRFPVSTGIKRRK